MFNNSIVQEYHQPTGIKLIDIGIEKETLQLFSFPFPNELYLLFSLSLEGKCMAKLFEK